MKKQIVKDCELLRATLDAIDRNAHGARLLEDEEIESMRRVLAFVDSMSKKRIKELFPDDMKLDDKARGFAEKKGFRGSQIEEMWERFDAYHRSGGTESADWSASWRTWVLNQIRFGERPQVQAPSPRPYQSSLADMAERTDLAPAPRRGARF